MNESPGFSGLSDLLDVQAVDSASDKLLADREGMPELAEHAAAAQAAAEAAAARDQAEALLQEVDGETKRVDDELQLAEQTLSEREDRLYAGGMSAREADTMRIDVENLGKQNSAMEDELLELLEKREKAAAAAQEANQAAEETEKVKRGLAETIARKQSEIDVQLAAQVSRRGELTPAVPPDLLELYEELRARRGGVGAGVLNGRSCGACHMEMSMAEYEEVVEEFPPRCIHCQAIVVP